MAGTAVSAYLDVEPTDAVADGSVLDHVLASIRLLVDDLEVLRVALSAGGVTLVNELRTDHATNKTMTDELHVDVDLNGAALEAILAKLDADGGITDTNYVALHGRSGSGVSIQAAAITATDVATITAAAASTTAVDAAADMVGYKVTAI